MGRVESDLRAEPDALGSRAMSEQPRTAQDVMALVAERDIRFVRFWFTDILGQLKSFSVNAAELDEAFAQRPRLRRILDHRLQRHRGVRHGRPAGPVHLRRAALAARGAGGRAHLLRHPHAGEAPRTRATRATSCARAIKRAEQMGFEAFNVAPELEYFLFKDATGTEVLDRGRLLRPHDARRGLRRAPRDRPGPRAARRARRLLPPRVRARPSTRSTCGREPALKAADDVMTQRITVKELAMKAGWHATFMPKPLFGENGSGMHTNMSLTREGQNAFFDADDPYHLSDVGKAFIAGQLRHARELSSVFAQWVNSYKRLVPGYEAPVYVAWSRRNRSALVRVPLHQRGQEQSTRMELRCPDPACNPYLTFAALLQAGLEGIEKGYELPEPMEKNLYHLAPDDRRRLGHRAAARDPGRGDRAHRGVRARAAHLRRAHVQPLRRDQAAGVGGLPRPGHPVGARPVPAGPLSRLVARATIRVGAVA